MSQEYKEFLTVIGALSKLVLLSIIIERGLAFIFEHDWFVRFLTREIQDPNEATKKVRESRLPGLKGLIALLSAIGLCFTYDFDMLSAIFNQPADPIGKVITAIVTAGGSAGAIAVFQGFLNINKDSRDALIAARKAEAEAAKQIAESSAAEAKAKKEKAEAEKAEAEARRKIAEAQVRT